MNWKNWTIGVVSTVLSAAVVIFFGNKMVGAADFYSISFDYHSEMNRYFNNKMEVLTELLEEDDFFEDANFNAADGCGEENVSSYCVSMGALDRYISYVNTLQALNGTLPERSESDSASDLLEAEVERGQQIDQEIEEARQSLEAALAIYDEFRLAYPMHVRYREAIFNLNKYKYDLKDVRQQVDRFPGKFLNASTSQCK